MAKRKAPSIKSPPRESGSTDWTHTVIKHREIKEPNCSLYPNLFCVRSDYEPTYSHVDILDQMRKQEHDFFE